MTTQTPKINPYLAMHIEDFLTKHPFYSRENAEHYALSTQTAPRLPWCPKCSDWHFSNEAHS